MTRGERTSGAETLRGVVEATNEKGLKLDGRWLNYSQFRRVTPPEVGQEVEVVRDRFINAITVVGGTGGGEVALEPDERLQPPGDDPMLDFDERDLFALAQVVGFRELHLEYQAHVTGMEPGRWEPFVSAAPNPRVPTLEEAINQALTPDEQERFVAHLRPQVEAGQGTLWRAAAYLWAVKQEPRARWP